MQKSFKYYIPIILGIVTLTVAGFVFVSHFGGQKPAAGKQKATLSADGKTKLFTHPSLGFSFEYPKDFNVGQFDEGDGNVVLVRSASASVQIYAQSFDEPGPITAARIKKDLPDQLVANPQTISAGGEAALLFDSQEDGTGKTREAWFVHNGQLYRLTAPSSASDILQTIISSWKFN